jgi:tRNA(adenine34) deaminase
MRKMVKTSLSDKRLVTRLSGTTVTATQRTFSTVMEKKNAKKWSHQVKTVSTFPPKGIFTKDAKSIARSLGSKKVSPKGISSGIRMIQFFINRAGKNLSPKQKEELEEAKHILQIKNAKKRGNPNARPTKKG